MYILASNRSRWLFYSVSLLLLYITCVWLSDSSELFEHRFYQYGHFFFIGLCAAIVANATGAGGGIIFLPAFTLMGITTDTALSTSFAIQCFGMTSGALAWISFRNRELQEGEFQWHGFSKTLYLSCIGSLIGLLLAQYLLPTIRFDVHTLFSVFSILVGLYIVLTPLLFKSTTTERRHPLSSLESIILVFVAIIGGLITAWLSIGVGELVAIVLLAMGFRIQQAIAVAVCVSSITVLSGVIFHITQGSIDTNILFFAAPAAMIGGAIARLIATWLGAVRLKTLMGTWITISGIVYLQVGISS